MIQKQVSRSASGECDDGLLETEIHDVLRNDRRRMVLEALGDEDAPLTVRELSETIAAREAGQDPPPRKVRESAYIALHQTHLPKLDDLDVIEYDDTTKEVVPGANAANVCVYMDAVPDASPSFTEYYATLTTIVAVLVATAAGVPVLDRVATLTWVLLTFAAIGLSAAHQTYAQRGSLVHRLRQ